MGLLITWRGLYALAAFTVCLDTREHCELKNREISEARDARVHS